MTAPKITFREVLRESTPRERLQLATGVARAFLPLLAGVAMALVAGAVANELGHPWWMGVAFYGMADTLAGRAGGER
jgi:hypothetical protein